MFGCMNCVNPRLQGDLGELSAIQWLASRRARVWIPLGHSPDADLVAEVDGRLVRVQVKTSTVWRTGRYEVTVATRGGNRSWNGVAKRLNAGRYDYLFVLVANGRRWFIPSRAIDGCFAVKLGGPKYAAFEVEPGEPISSAPPKLEAFGGAPESGEPGAAVNRVPSAERVRIPPPP